MQDGTHRWIQLLRMQAEYHMDLDNVQMMQKCVVDGVRWMDRSVVDGGVARCRWDNDNVGVELLVPPPHLTTPLIWRALKEFDE